MRRWHNGRVNVAAKLQIKAGHTVAVLFEPDDVSLELPESVDPPVADAVLVFVITRRELKDRSGPFVDAARRDALAWIAYPKGGQLGTDLNRDSLWDLLGEQGIRPVRQVSIDATWSALRFRPA